MQFGFSINFNSADEFVTHWASKYNYDDLPYEKNIGRPLTVDSRHELFAWKNGYGSSISALKLASIETNYPLTFDVGRIEERYLRPKPSGGAIWNIFYAHCLQPTVWPIFDTHVCRAMWYIRQGEFREIPKNKSEKLRVYREEFIKFHSSFGTLPERRVDKALLMFGKFLSTAKKYV